MLHVSSIPTGHTPKRLHKVQVLLDALVAISKAICVPHPTCPLTKPWLDSKEDLVRSSTYLTNQISIKAFTLADSENGYILDTLLYTGADTLDHSDPQYASLPQPARIVLTLGGDYLEKGRTIYTDRYYTSIPLAQMLESNKTAFTGTCMKNRKQIPQAFHQNNFRLSDDEVHAYRSGNLLSLAW